MIRLPWALVRRSSRSCTQAVPKSPSPDRNLQWHVLLLARKRGCVQAEAAEVAHAKAELRRLLSANEVNKQLKEKARLEDQALDRKYAREYAEKLDKEEQAPPRTSKIPPPPPPRAPSLLPHPHTGQVMRAPDGRCPRC